MLPSPSGGISCRQASRNMTKGTELPASLFVISRRVSGVVTCCSAMAPSSRWSSVERARESNASAEVLRWRIAVMTTSRVLSLSGPTDASRRILSRSSGETFGFASAALRTAGSSSARRGDRSSGDVSGAEVAASRAEVRLRKAPTAAPASAPTPAPSRAPAPTPTSPPKSIPSGPPPNTAPSAPPATPPATDPSPAPMPAPAKAWTPVDRGPLRP